MKRRLRKLHSMAYLTIIITTTGKPRTDESSGTKLMGMSVFHFVHSVGSCICIYHPRLSYSSRERESKRR